MFEELDLLRVDLWKQCPVELALRLLAGQILDAFVLELLSRPHSRVPITAYLVHRVLLEYLGELLHGLGGTEGRADLADNIQNDRLKLLVAFQPVEAIWIVVFRCFMNARSAGTDDVSVFRTTLLAG